MNHMLISFLTVDRVEDVIPNRDALTIQRTDGTRTSRALTSAESRTVRAELAQLACA